MAAALGPRLVPAGELDDATRGEIVALCELAFREDFSHFFARLPGATHVLLRDECGALLSHVCWVERGLQPRGLPVLRAAYVEAMATHPDRQREGHGTAVLRFLVDEIRAAGGYELAALSPSVPHWYARRGWKLWRGPLIIRHGQALEPSPAQEQVMILRLPLTPPTLDMEGSLTAEWREGELW